MPNQELHNYIYAQSQRGVSADEIRKTLEQNGWSKQDIETAFTIVQPKGAPATTIAKPLMTPSQPAVTQPVAQPAAMPATPAMGPAQAGPVVDMFDEVQPSVQPAMTQPMMSQTPAMQPAAMQSPMMSPAANGGMPGASVFTNPGQESAVMSAQVASPSKRGMGKKMIMIGVIVAVVLGVLAGGAYAYYRYTNSPEKVGAAMLQNLSQLKSFNYQLGLQPREIPEDAVNALGEQLTAMEITAEGSVDASGSKPNMSGVLAMSLETSSASTYRAAAELRYVAGILYGSIQDITIPALQAFNLPEDTWYALSPDDPALLEQIESFKAAQTSTELSQDQITRIQEAFRDSNAVTFGNKIGSETIHDVKTAQYSFAVSKVGLKQFIGSVTTIVPDLCKDACSELNERVDALQDITGSIWIGTKDHQLYQLRTIVSDTSGSLPEDTLVTLTLWNHNQSQVIEVPTPTKPFAELFADIFKGLFGGLANDNANDNLNNALNTNANENENANTNATVNTNATTNTNSTNTNSTNTNSANSNTNAATNTNASTGSADSDADGLTNTQETLYETDPNDSDSDNDGYLDGDEVEHGYNPAGPGTLEQ